MNHLRNMTIGCIGVAISVLSFGCSSVGTEEGGTVDALSQAQALPPGQCNRATDKDVLIAQLVKDSLLTNYPLTRLSTDASGAVVGPSLPDSVAGDLEIINSVPAARASVSKALAGVTGLPEYTILSTGPDTAACTAIPAWTPTGSTIVDTTSIEVFPGTTNYASWRTTHKEFGKECSLVKRIGNKDIVDPPGDGSTNAPPSSTVSATGVTANAFGNCPTGTPVGTFCKLSYATGVNYTGRKCRTYFGSLRCLLY